METWLNVIACTATVVSVGVGLLVFLPHHLKSKYQQRRGLLLICLEKDYGENDRTNTAMKYLGKAALNIVIINDPYKCEQWLNNHNDDSKIILIISRTVGEHIIPRVHSLSSILIIYLYCNDSKYTSPLMEKYSKVKGMITDFNQLIQYLSMYWKNVECNKHERWQGISEKTADLITKYCQLQSSEEGKEVQGSHLDKFQFVLVGLSTHLNEIAEAMLKCLRSLSAGSIFIFDDGLINDLEKLPQKRTLLFVSSQCTTMINSKLAQFENVFILDNGHNMTDHQNTFSTVEGLIFQLADELYRCYRLEARDSLSFGDVHLAESKEKQADRIHPELKKAYRSMCKSKDITAVVVDATTTIVWLKFESTDDIEVKKAQGILSGIIPPFLLFNTKVDWQNYLNNTELRGTLFIITDSDDENLLSNDYCSSSNILTIYRYGKTSSKNDDDLCFQLLSDLASHYNKLGTIYSAKKDRKTAKDMFLKVPKLYNILAKF